MKSPSNEETMERLRDPKVGDLFSEMISFWVAVLEVTETHVTIAWHFKSKKKEILHITKEDYIDKCCYSGCKDESFLYYYGECEERLLEYLQSEIPGDVFVELEKKGVKEAMAITKDIVEDNFLIFTLPSSMSHHEYKVVAEQLYGAAPEGAKIVLMHEDINVELSKIDPNVLYRLVESYKGMREVVLVDAKPGSDSEDLLKEADEVLALLEDEKSDRSSGFFFNGLITGGN